MGVLLGFLPFVAFAALSGALGATGALIAGAVVSAALIVRGRLKGGSWKILELGTFILFCAVAIAMALAGGTLSVIGVRLCVDIGLLGIVLVSLAVGRPFTLEYAREQVAPEHWGSPVFLRANIVITSGWAVAFLVMVLAETALLCVPALPPAVGVLAIIAALLGGVVFTRWYAKVGQAAARQARAELPR
ncbi:MAG TPA: hypothetical protein VME47_15355 [Acetobacteraceae bacterium]|nr:hypothetical protein [Acetobacteraceae bacterium]